MLTLGGYRRGEDGKGVDGEDGREGGGDEGHDRGQRRVETRLFGPRVASANASRPNVASAVSKCLLTQ